MGQINDDLRRRVRDLKDQVTQAEYEAAIESLKELGGQYAVFAAAHAALVAAALGAAAGAVALSAAVVTGPISAGILGGILGPGIAFGYIGGANVINRWYAELSAANREALAKVIARGVTVSRVLRRAWKLVAR